MNIKTTFILKWRRPLIFLVHAVLATASYFLAFLIRFDLNLFHSYYPVFWQTLPLVVLLKLMALIYFDLHRGLWRYASVNDLWRIIKVCISSAILLTVVIAFFPGFQGFPRSVIPIDLGLSILLFGGKRFSIRMFREYREGRESIARGARRVLIAGAGAAGIMAMKEMKSDRRQPSIIVGFLDDDPHKKSMMLDGRRVLGPLSEVKEWVKAMKADEVVLAMPSAPKRVGRELVEQCRGLPVKLRTLPPLADLLSGRMRVSAIHDIQLDDLLGRDPVALDRNAVIRMMQDTCILVTGAGGSIGAEISRQLATCRPGTLALLDVAETPLFQIENELRNRHPDLSIKPILADVRNGKEMDAILQQCRPRYVFHAAAYKHVPMLEAHPVEAILNNILGTQNVAQAAARAGVGKFLLISTDKAVDPCSVMGATKRCAELVVQGMNHSSTSFMAVRFGNVLGSNGSVVPLFRKQIEAGGPVTITDREATRYFMTIPEAVELVLQAMHVGRSGDLYILEMGKPVRIFDMARQLIELAGLALDDDIQIREIGLRPGEKLHEKLFDNQEKLAPSKVPCVHLLEDRKDLDRDHIEANLQELLRLASRRDAEAARNQLWRIIQDLDNGTRAVPSGMQKRCEALAKPRGTPQAAALQLASDCDL